MIMIYKRLASVAILCSLILASALCVRSVLLDEPPVIKTSTIKLPDETKVQVEEEFSPGGWDDDAYKYRFVHKGKPIASSFQWNGSMDIQTGKAGNTVYFFQRQLICIYANSRWVTWDMSEKSFTAWWKSFEKADGKSWFTTPHHRTGFGIKRFLVNGKQWTIKLHTGITKWEDWSGGRVPGYIHVQSSDFGKSWSVREKISLHPRK